MDNVNKTLYIPLYGKAYVSRKGIILKDEQAEYIWEKEGFPLKGKSKSKWLAYYMGMRAAVFDEWLKNELEKLPDRIVLHIGCGMDSRINRVGNGAAAWYDVDFPDVIKERKKYYKESDAYHMLAADARKTEWIRELPPHNAIVVLEGISMYFTHEEMQDLLKALVRHFGTVNLLVDCYTVLAEKTSKYKNLINDVGVTRVYGVDTPDVFADNTGLRFLKEHDMTPRYMVDDLGDLEKIIFKSIFGGRISKRMYRLYEYGNCDN